MSKLARTLVLVTMLAAMNLAALPAIANVAPPQSTADATRAGLAQERYYSTWGYGGASTPAAPAPPSGQPTWLVIAQAVLVTVLALVAGVVVLAARRATRGQHAGQAA